MTVEPGPAPTFEIDPAALAALAARRLAEGGAPAPGTAAGTLQVSPETVEQDLARLVLGLMEFLRQLMELQAIRRMEAGDLAAAQEEALGTTLMRAEAAIRDQAVAFGLDPDDLSLDLGPLGRTV